MQRACVRAARTRGCAQGAGGGSTQQCGLEVFCGCPAIRGQFCHGSPVAPAVFGFDRFLAVVLQATQFPAGSEVCKDKFLVQTVLKADASVWEKDEVASSSCHAGIRGQTPSPTLFCCPAITSVEVLADFGRRRCLA